MKTIQIQELSQEDLKELIAEVIKPIFNQIQENKADRTEYITRQQTASLLSISLPTLNEYTKKGIVKGYRLGSRVRYIKAEVEASLKQIEAIKYRGI